MRASGTQATSRPERSGDQVLLPLPQNRRKHCVSAGFLFTCVVWLWCSRWFRQWVFTSVCICPHLLPSPPAPKTHPVSPFSAFPGGVRFLPSLGPQKFGDDFVAWLAAPLPFEHEKGRDCPPAFSQLIPLTPFCRCRAGNTCLFAPAAPHGCRSLRSYRFPAPGCGRRPGCWTPAGR